MPKEISKFEVRYAARCIKFLLANSADRATTRGLEMQMEDALDFRDGLRQIEGTVRAGDDQFGLRAVEVRALI
jgi:hypothetical protein